MIEESFVSFEIAEMLKEKGFDEPCHCYYNTNSLSIYPVYGAKEDYTNSDFEEDVYVCYSAPTQQMACRWLREVHNIHVCPEYKPFFQERPKKLYHHWCNKIIGIGRSFNRGINEVDVLDSDYFYFRSCKTYHDSFEDACMECIEFALRNLI